MKTMQIGRLAMALVLVGVCALGGCATNRRDMLRDKADDVGSRLKAEQQRVVAMDQMDPTRAARLDHLTQLRASLSAANVALGAVPRFFKDTEQQTAFDVLEEVYDTIDWNIPLGPGEQPRKVPSQFSTGVLKLN
jgi:hypothetical protein